MSPHVETVRFSLYSFAYARTTLPQDTLTQLFQLNVLVWEVNPHESPRLRIGGIICPFLTIHWDKTTKDTFQRNLEQIAKSAPPAFQLLLVYILHDLTTKYYDFMRETGEETMGVIAHALISLYITVWEQVTSEYPDLYPDHSQKVQREYLTHLYTFLRYPPDSESVFQALCGIHPARPQVCRVFPLGRWMTGECTDSHLFTPTDQRVLLQKRICPPHAFIQGPSQTATQFLCDQQVENYEYAILFLVGEFLQLYADYLDSWPPYDIQHVYQGLIQRMYYAQAYTPDMEAFYQQLYTQLNTFIQGFHELYQRFH